MCCIKDFILSILAKAETSSIFFGLILTALTTSIICRYIWKLIFPKTGKLDGYEEQWFGKGPSPLENDEFKESFEDTSIRPFKIDVSDTVLNDLRERLANTRFEDSVEDSKFLYGFNSNYLREVVKYWKDEYNWWEQEKMLNQFPQFKTKIEGIDVHFLHVKPTLPEGTNLKVLPLMIIHGWPGSVTEFYKIIPLLTTPRPEQNFVFEVICPSIPGFGFSESPHKKGFHARVAARFFITLMERLGHRHFYVQGGDWGSAISSLMARFYAPRVAGLHVNMYSSGFQPFELFKLIMIAIFPFLVSKEEYRTIFPVKRFFKQIYEEGAYFHMQSTKPDTLGSGMCDSPAGMVAYLLEKFSYATNADYVNLPDGGLTKKFSLDELLTNIMLYWVNNNFTAAARIYKETVRDKNMWKYRKVPVTVPSAVAVFPHEVLMVPKTCMSQQMKNLISYNIMPRGGHFAALEEPELLADDIWKFVSIVEKQK